MASLVGSEDTQKLLNTRCAEQDFSVQVCTSSRVQQMRQIQYTQQYIVCGNYFPPFLGKISQSFFKINFKQYIVPQISHCKRHLCSKDTVPFTVCRLNLAENYFSSSILTSVFQQQSSRQEIPEPGWYSVSELT